MTKKTPTWNVTAIATHPNGSVILTLADGSAICVRRVSDGYSAAVKVPPGTAPAPSALHTCTADEFTASSIAF